jgi:peptidoglycan/LPS O-acetylase OafA/YrhL
METNGAPGGHIGSARVGDSGRPREGHRDEHTERVVRKRRRRRTDDERAGMRLDIQGLRMVAVMLVVLSHMFDGARGGLVGVDVFFVISGFLITGLLLRELQETSRLSLVGFYRRRIRRIVPAATLALVAITVAAYLLFATYRFKQTVIDAVWALVFAANWRFASEGTNYLDANGPVSPVQHYWSLSVEEQFYFVWPGLILVIGVITSRGWIRGKFALAACVMGIVVVASLAYALAESAHNPALAYFSSFARVWELGVGAVLAITASNFPRIPSRLRPFLLWTGLDAIGLGAFIPADLGVFPIWQIAIAVVGAGMAITAGTGETPRYSTILTNRLSVYLGDVSYSLYLWHWPVIVFLGLLMPGSVFFHAAAFLLMFGLAIAAYEFFENPIRHSNWLGQKGVNKRGGGESHTRRHRRAKRNMKSLQPAGAISLTMVSAGVAMVVLTPATTQSSANPANPSVSNSQESANLAQQQPEQAKLSVEISQALRVEEWPVLSPPLDGRADNFIYIKDCMYDTRNSISDCTRGDLAAPHTIVLVGDSGSMSYTGAFESIVNASNGKWRLELRNFLGCSFMAGHYLLPDYVDDAKEEACPRLVESTISAIEAERPDIVVVTNGYWPHKFVSSREAQSPQERRDSIRNVLLRISKSSGKVILMSPPPDVRDTRICYTAVSSPTNCVASLPESWPDYEWIDRSVTDGVDNASFLSTWRWFCSESKLCPAFAGTIPMRFDSHHLTGAFSRRLGPVVQEAFSAVGVTF